MNQFLIGLVERATLRAPVLERRGRSLFEPNAPGVAGPLALEGDDPGPGDLDAQLAAPLAGSARRAPREPTREGEPAEPWHRSEPSPAGAPRRSERSGARDDEPRPAFAALDHGSLEPDAQPDAAPVTASIALAPAPEIEDPGREHGDPAWSARHRADDEPHVFAAPIAHRDVEPTARLVPSLAIALPERPRRDQGAQPQQRSTGRLQRHAPALDGDAVRGTPRASAARAASPDPATAAPALAAHGGAPATNAPVLRSGPRVPGPSALLVQSQRPADLSRIGGIAAAAPPPVHVTIGRLEVRANGPGADRPPARRSAGPKLTLDDYLHGRRGGSR